MTLILTCLTQDYVVQVADRRLTVNGALVEDEACKQVLWQSQAIVSYTGLARVAAGPLSDDFLDPGQTDMWLFQTLQTVPVDTPAMIEQLRESATSVFRTIMYATPEQRRHSFVVAGWKQGRDGETKPFIAVISNAESPDGSWEDRARPDFTVARHTLARDRRAYVRASGVRLLSAEIRAIRQEAATVPSSEPATLVGVLGRAVWRAADRNPSVGRGLLISVLPKAGIGSDEMGIWARPSFTDQDRGSVPELPRDRISWLYAPSRGNLDSGSAPRVIRGQVAMAHFTFRPGVSEVPSGPVTSVRRRRPAPTNCIFCGSTTLVGANIFCQSILDELPDRVGVYELDNPAGSLYIDPARDLGPPDVCGDCAKEISEIDGAIGDLLASMVRGEQVRLDLQAQALVAVWCAKTAILLDALHEPSARQVPARYSFGLPKRKGVPPPFSQVRLFSAEPMGDRIVLARTKVPLPSGVEGWSQTYRTTLRIGAFGFEIVGSWPPGRALRVEWASQVAQALHSIWAPWGWVIDFPIKSFATYASEPFMRGVLDRDVIPAADAAPDVSGANRAERRRANRGGKKRGAKKREP